MKSKTKPLRTSKMVTNSENTMKFTDTMCIICSKRINSDPVAIVLQNPTRLSALLTAFCQTMKISCEIDFDFSVEPFPFCRKCEFQLNEVEEIYNEMVVLQKRMDNLASRFATKILETAPVPLESQGVVKSNGAGVFFRDGENKKGGIGIEQQELETGNLKKSRKLKESVVKRFQPRLLLRKLESINCEKNELQPTAWSVVKCPQCFHEYSVPAVSAGPGGLAGVQPLFSDNEIKKKLADLINIMEKDKTSFTGTSAMNTDSDIWESAQASRICDFNTDEVLRASLAQALSDTRDAWVTSYLAQLFAFSYHGQSLWGSKALRRVQTDLIVPDEMTTPGAPDPNPSAISYDSTFVETVGHVPLRLIPCRLCSNEFKSHYQLRKHLYHVHGTGFITKFKCNYCAKELGRKKDMITHLVRQHQVESSLGVFEDHYIKIQHKMGESPASPEKKLPDSHEDVIEPCINPRLYPVASREENIPEPNKSGIEPCINSVVNTVASREENIPEPNKSGIEPCINSVVNTVASREENIPESHEGGTEPCIKAVVNPVAPREENIPEPNKGGHKPCIKPSVNPVVRLAKLSTAEYLKYSQKVNLVL